MSFFQGFINGFSMGGRPALYPADIPWATSHLSMSPATWIFVPASHRTCSTGLPQTHFLHSLPPSQVCTPLVACLFFFPFLWWAFKATLNFLKVGTQVGNQLVPKHQAELQIDHKLYTVHLNGRIHHHCIQHEENMWLLRCFDWWSGG